MAPEEAQDVYSVGQAALFIGQKESTILDYIFQGLLPGAFLDPTTQAHRIPFSDLKVLSTRSDQSLDVRVRAAAMSWLEQRTSDGADAIHNSDLEDFHFEGEKFRLKDITKGIRKPAVLEAALSITTVYRKPGKDAPYKDEVGPDGLLRYKWEGIDPDFYTNRGLRRALELKLPLIWFFGVGDSQFQAIFPVYILAEEPDKNQFVLDVGSQNNPSVLNAPGLDVGQLVYEKKYKNQLAKVRIHQRVFRSSVIRAYGGSCAICNLKHKVLLDAAHIIPDSEEDGIASVQNGMALCKIHHAAFDAKILGVSPTLVVHIREDILDEIDGPMLKHGLQERHMQKLMKIPITKSERPASELLEKSFASFLQN